MKSLALDQGVVPVKQISYIDCGMDDGQAFFAKRLAPWVHVGDVLVDPDPYRLGLVLQGLEILSGDRRVDVAARSGHAVEQQLRFMFTEVPDALLHRCKPLAREDL